ncbi:MAG TPA: thioesterase family protein [Flavitalea sp.]|nr:thioesterase family protein [Flavitalea sp.]
MARVKIDLPATFRFQTTISIRITDLNYGGHVGNDRILSLIHEARVDYLQSLGYSELNIGGVSLIMADVAIEYKNELFHGDKLLVDVSAGDFSSSGFDLFYRLQKTQSSGEVLIAKAKTGMVCFDYSSRKVMRVPDAVKQKLLDN